MKCWVLLINRKRGKLIKKAEYNATAGIFKRGLFKGDEGFYIPDNAVPIEVEYKRNRTIPLWHVNELTGCVLSVEHIPEQLPEKEGDQNETEKPKDKVTSLKPIEYERKKGYGGQILICERSDPETKLKLNVLIKQAFWEMLAKQLKMKLLTTLIYLGAGYGLFRFG